jgi:hypothetical protein
MQSLARQMLAGGRPETARWRAQPMALLYRPGTRRNQQGVETEPRRANSEIASV